MSTRPPCVKRGPVGRGDYTPPETIIKRCYHVATDRIQTGIRFPEALLRKLTYIARKNHRSLNAQLEHLAQQCVDEYEKEHGTIEFPPEE